MFVSSLLQHPTDSAKIGSYCPD